MCDSVANCMTFKENTKVKKLKLKKINTIINNLYCTLKRNYINIVVILHCVYMCRPYLHLNCFGALLPLTYGSRELALLSAELCKSLRSR